MEGFKTINESFTEEEYNRLIKAKAERNWHDFIMLLVNIKVRK